MNIDQKQAFSAKKHFAPDLRKAIGTDDLENFETHTLTWDELHTAKQGLRSLGEKSMNMIESRAATGADTKSLSDAGEAIIAAWQEIEGEMDCRKRLGNNGPRNHGGDSRRPAPNTDEVPASGEPADARAEGLEAETTSILLPEHRMADGVSRESSRHLNGLTVGRYFRAMVTGGSTDVERRALAEGTDSAGGFSVPEVLSANLLDLMRASNVAMRAGAMTVPLTSDRNHIAKVATDPVPAWRAENAVVNESDPTFSRVEFVPKSLAVLVKVSRELLEDSLNIEQELPRIMAAAMARELDRVVFLGTGTNDEPSGLDTISGVLDSPHDAALASYSPLVTARRLLMGQNNELVSAYVMHPDTEATLGDLTDSTGQPLNYPTILDRPLPLQMLTTTQLPVNLGTGTNETTIYAGDFSKLMIGLRSGIRVEVLKERYASNLQYGFLIHARYDVVASHPNAFCRITGIQL
jgi:HK97 family phage major capsid protein